MSRIDESSQLVAMVTNYCHASPEIKKKLVELLISEIMRP